MKAVNQESAESRNILVIDRFTSFCLRCKDHFNQNELKCPHCGVVFTHVTTRATCPWMQDVVRNSRPDLVWLDPKEVKGIKLIL